MALNIPNALTVSRVLLVPVFVFAVYRQPLVGAAVFIVASLTDLLDGYLARRSRQVTRFGIILDPLADKFLVIAALIVLVDVGLVAAWIAIVIVIREFLVTVLRLVALARDQVIPAEAGGKWKTGTQITAVIILLFVYGELGLAVALEPVGQICIWASMILGVYSGMQYLTRYIKTQ